jgi:hypothetical protein
MTKVKRSRSSLAKTLVEHSPFSSPEFNKPKLVSEALLECIRMGDANSFRFVLRSYIGTARNARLKKMGIGNREFIAICDFSKKYNPELSAVSMMLRGLSA